MVAQNIFFYAIAAVIVWSAFRVVTTQNVVHAALHLVAVLASVAAQYILLAAEFVAATQVLVYIGAIVVLFLFGIMLTRAKIGRDQELTHKSAIVGGALTALLLLAVMGYSLLDEFGWSRTPLPEDSRLIGVNGSNSATVSDSIFSQYLVPFEVISVLLLAALVGAIVLARKD
ncbi:MAG: NADH-quinone oxidoreductase subunit J [Acidimicrobiales bacterium]|nr:NADH-quinone oxidoreductase subunit J [Acidimicrobiales bacterium]